MSTLDRTCLSFDGSNDYLDCGSGPSIDSAITVEAWVKNSSNQNGIIVARGGGWSEYGYALFWYNGKIRVELQGLEQTSSNVGIMVNVDKETYDNPAPTDGKWHHLAFTWSKSSKKAITYIDGVAQSTQGSFDVSVKLDSMNLNIGRNEVHAFPFKGQMAEVRIWNDVRSQSELQANMNRRLTGSESGLVGCWPLAGTTKDNSSQGNNATNNGATWAVDNDLQLFSDDEMLALALAGSTGYVNCGAIDFTSGEYTVETWFNTSKTAQMDILSATNGGHGLLLEIQSNGTLRYLHRYPYKSSGGTNIYSSDAYNDGQWHQVTAVRSSSTMSLYIDGQLIESKAAPTAFADSLSMVLGRLSIDGSSRYFNGQLSDVRVWQVARSQIEIQDSMYNRLWGNETGLAAYWKLDSVTDSVDDSSSSNYKASLQGDAKWGVTNSLPLAEAKVDDAVLSFDGANDYVSSSPASSWSASQFTVELWVKPASTGQAQYVSVFNNYSGSTGTGTFQIDFDGSGNYRLNHNNGAFSMGTPSTSWQHLAVTYDGTTLKTYVDGVVQTSQSASLTTTFTNYMMGCNRSNNSFFAGSIAEVRIWDEAHSQSQLESYMYRRLGGGESGLAAYFPLNKGYSAATQNYVEGAAATISGASWQSDADFADSLLTGADWVIAMPQPVNDAVLALDGVDDYMDCGAIDFAQGEYTLEAWFKTSSSDKDSFLAATDGNHGILLEVGDNGRIRYLHRYPLGSSGGKNLYSSATVNDGQWHHVAAVVSSTNMLLYIDGQQVGSTSAPDPFPSSLDVVLGRLAITNNARPFNGSLSEVRIWNIARSQSEIQTNMNNRVWGSESGLVAYWPLNSGEVGQTIASDKVGNHNATINGADWTADSSLSLSTPLAIENPVLSFDGVDNYVLSTPAAAWSAAAFTLEFWAKPASTGQVQYTGLFNNQTGSTGTGSFQIDFDGSGNYRLNHNNGAFSLGTPQAEWQHLAVSYDGSTLKTYLNGEEQTSQSASLTTEFQNFVIGRNRSADSYFAGEMADVRVWGVARTQAEIQGTMNGRLWGTESGLVANWQLNESSSTAADTTGKYNGTISGAVQVASSLVLTAVTSTTLITTTNPAATFTQTESFASSSDLSEYNLPTWLDTLISEVESAMDGGNLGLSADSFSEFNLFANLGDLNLFDTIQISDVTLELIASAEVDLSSVSESSAEVGLGISGTVDLLGLYGADIGVEFTINDSKEKTALVKVKGQDVSSNISDLLGGSVPNAISDVLDVLSGLTLSTPSFAFATESMDDDDDPFSVGVSEGFNFYGLLDVSELGSDNDFSLGGVLAFIAGLLGVELLTIHVGINKTAAGMRLELDAIIEQDLTIIPGNSFNLTYKGATISLVMSGTPPEPALSVSNTMVLTLDYIGADDLYLIGTIKTETESLTAAYTLQQSPGSDSVWHPFGYSQLSVGALAIQFGGTYLAPWIDNFGIAAQDLTIGSVSGSLAILIDTNDPDQFVFYMQTDHITLLELISCLSPLTFIAYQALPNSITNALEKVIDVSLSDVEISIVPAATQIGELVFEDEGINAKGTLSAWGWEATADISVSTSEIDIYAEMEPLRLSVGSVELFSIEGAQGDENATYSLYIGTEEIPEFYMSVSVTLLGVRNEVYASLDESGLKFILEYSATYLSYSLSTILDETKLYVSGSMDFVLNMSVTLPVLGKLRLVDVSLAAEATLQIDSAFYLHLAGSFNFYGAGFSLTVTVNEALPNFTAVFDALVDYIEDNAEEIFKELFNTLSEWADAVADGAVWFAGSVADVAKDAYGLGEDAVDAIIDASQTIGDGAVKIAEGMKDAYNWSEKKVANALQDAGYAVEEVANALVDAYSATEKVVATALKAAGYTATQIANGLADAYNTSVTAVAGVLEDLGYSATAVANAVEDAFNATSTEVAKALKAAGYTIDEITNALDSAFNTTAEGIATALKAAGYAVDEVGDALMDAFDMTEDALEDALKGAGYAAKEVGNWLDDTFNPSKW